MSPPPPPLPDVAAARRILETNAKMIALVPVDRAVETWPLLLRLGQALNFLGHSSLALVRGPAPDQAPRAAEAGARPGPGDAFRILDLDGTGNLVELILPPAVGLLESLGHLERAVGRSSGLFSHFLAGFESYIPDIPEALELPDAFVTAARAGRTKETDLVELVRLLPPSRHLGTLLLE